MNIRLLALLFCFASACASLSAQDILIKSDGTELEVKVLEVTEDAIKYKLFDNIEGPIYTVKQVDVFMIKYENGTKDIFTTKAEKEETPKESGERKVVYSKVEYKRQVVDREVFNLIKLNPLLILVGDIPIYLEHRFADKLSYEIGLGLTHLDYLYEGYSSDLDVYNAHHSPKLGFSGRASLRFYPSSYTKALDEFYIGPEIRFRRHNFELDKCGEGIPEPVAEFRTVTDAKISGGYIFYLSDMVIIDIYGGLGLRFHAENRASCVESGPVSVAGNAVLTKETLPAVSFGFKVGFGL